MIIVKENYYVFFDRRRRKLEIFKIQSISPTPANFFSMQKYGVSARQTSVAERDSKW